MTKVGAPGSGAGSCTIWVPSAGSWTQTEYFPASTALHAHAALAVGGAVGADQLLVAAPRAALWNVTAAVISRQPSSAPAGSVSTAVTLVRDRISSGGGSGLDRRLDLAAVGQLDQLVSDRVDLGRPACRSSAQAASRRAASASSCWRHRSSCGSSQHRFDPAACRPRSAR